MPLRGRINLTTKVWVWSLGMILERYQAPKTAQPMGWLPLIVSYILILLRTHSTLHLKHTNTHTHLHTSKHRTRHFILNLTYIYHAYHHITNPSIHLSWQSTNPIIHLSCISSHPRQQTNKIFIRIETQTWQQGIKIKYNSNI